MTSVSWTGTQSGLWSGGANWSTGSSPLTGDDITISPNNPLTVTYNTGTLHIDSIYTTNATLAMTGGLLSVDNGYEFFGAVALSTGELRLVAGQHGDFLGGTVSETGGTLLLVGGGLAQGGNFSETGGVLTINNGVFTDQDIGTLASTVNGSGELVLNAPGIVTLNSGFTLATAAAEILGGDVVLNESLSYGKSFTEATGSTLSLNGNTLTLSGSAALDGTITSGGVVKASGTGHVNGLELDNGLSLNITGAYNQTGSILLGNTGSGTVTIGNAGSLRITNDSSIFTGAGGGVLVNNGMLVKAGGGSHGAESVIYAAFTNGSSATVAVNSGTLDFHGPSSGFTSTLAGTYMGAGTLAFDSGSFLIAGTAPTLSVSRLLVGGSANMTLTTALTYGGFWDQTSGTLVVGSPGQGVGALTLTGETALDGGLLKGTGTVLATGAVNLGAGVDLEGNLTFTFGITGVAGTVSQTGSINLGLQTDAITIANVTANETWALAGNSEILGFNGEINNAGTFAKVSGAFDSVVQSGINNTGTLAVDAGTLTLSGVGTLGGSVVGAAALDISGAYKFSNNLLLSVGEVILDNPAQPNEVQATLGGNLTFANDWSQDGGTLALGGHTLALTGGASLLAGSAVEGAGTIVTSGDALLGSISLLQGADIVVNGTCDQVGNVTLTGGSTAPTLTINGTYTMEPGDILGGPNNSVIGNVVVDSGGTLVAAGSGLNNGASETIAAGVLDNGKISLSHGEMQFLGSLSGTGVLSISNGATLDLLGSTSITNSVTFGNGGAILDLGTPDNFTGTIKGFATGDMIELNGFAFGSITPVISGNTVTLTEASGQSVTLTFSSAQTASQLVVGEGPHGWLSLIHL